MAGFRRLIKLFSPPILTDTCKYFFFKEKRTPVWEGDYSSWEDAKQKCSGYDNDRILEKCKEAVIKVKNGDAVYERDSVTFDKIQYSWGLLAGLQRVALENEGVLSVLDFGGSLGSTYFQNREFFSSMKSVSWNIVEQENFVRCGKEYFENDQLKFHYSVEDCLASQKSNVILLSSVLQYLENPYEWLERFFNLDISYIIIDRTAFINSENDLLTIQRVPASIYEASYPAWFFGNRMRKKLTEKKSICVEFDNGFSPTFLINGTQKGYWQGYILKK